MGYTLNTRHYRYFKNRCEHWKGILKVQYHVHYDRADTKNDLSYVRFLAKAHDAEIVLANHWAVEPTNKMLDKVAFHEILHLVMAPICVLATEFYSEEYIGELEHAIIISLENILK